MENSQNTVMETPSPNNVQVSKVLKATSVTLYQLRGGEDSQSYWHFRGLDGIQKKSWLRTCFLVLKLVPELSIVFTERKCLSSKYL